MHNLVASPGAGICCDVSALDGGSSFRMAVIVSAGVGRSNATHRLSLLGSGPAHTSTTIILLPTR
jgi:hypothetical protein